MACSNPIAFPAQAIIHATAAKYMVSVERIKKHGGKRKIYVRPRWEAFYLLRRDRQLSLPKIGKLMGGFDHTSVLHGIRRHAELNGLPDLTGMRPARV